MTETLRDGPPDAAFPRGYVRERPLDFMARRHQPTGHAAGTPPLPRVDANEVRDLRHAATAQLRRWALREEVVATANYVIGELVANAFLHGAVPGRDVVLTLSLYESAIDVAVADGCPRMPRLPHASADRQDACESGRGLLLVRNESSHLGGTWCFTRWSTGKVVTCTLPREPVGDHRERVPGSTTLRGSPKPWSTWGCPASTTPTRTAGTGRARWCGRRGPGSPPSRSAAAGTCRRRTPRAWRSAPSSTGPAGCAPPRLSRHLT